MKVDHAKDINEKIIDQAVTVLASTIPEQKIDAMKDYHKVIGLLKNGTDWQFKPIISKLELLYMYPGRKLHNKMIIDMHELRESMQEQRIDKIIENQSKKNSLEGVELGNGFKQLLIPLLLLFALSSLWR